jgi:hypothetical protein
MVQSLELAAYVQLRKAIAIANYQAEKSTNMASGITDVRTLAHTDIPTLMIATDSYRCLH